MQRTADNLRKQLAAQLQIAPDAVEVIAAESIEWPDACLGAGGPAEACALVATPGYRITLAVDGQQFIYHTDIGSYWTRLAEGPKVEVGAQIATWTGTVDNGSCQDAILGSEGVAFGYCGGGLKLGGKYISAARLATLAAYAARYAPFKATTDLGQINFTGSGAEIATTEQQRQLASWAQLVTMEAASGTPMGSLRWLGPAPIDSHDTSKCASLALGGGEATMVDCKGAIATMKLNGGVLSQWLEIQDAFAPFVIETPTTSLVFNGMGAIEGDVWRRALLAWARTKYAELSSGKASSADSTVLSWDLGPATNMETSCMHLNVLAWGHAYAETRPCAGGKVQDLTAGWLKTEEMEQLDTWLSNYAPRYAENGYVSGTGTRPIGSDELAAVEEWAARLWLRLRGVATPLEVDKPADQLSKCVTPTAGAQLLVNEAGAYCVVYPAGYVAEKTAPNVVNLVLGSIMNHTDPRVEIMVVDAGGRSLTTVGDEIVAQYAGFDVERGTTTVDGVQALVLDNLPGQDLNRRVAVIHEGRLYTFFFTPLGESADARAKLEAFYQGVLGAFRFLEAPTSPLPPPQAPVPVAGTAVEYVMALANINIRQGPDTSYPVVGKVFEGQIAKVTGVAPAGGWWRVMCPDDTVGDCWVTGDPALTQPTTAP